MKFRTFLLRLFRAFTWLAVFMLVGVVLLWVWIQTEVMPTLPAVESLKTVQYQEPLRIYSADGKLISEFGSERRIPLEFKDIPPQMIHAILAIEDARFYEHHGVDFKGLIRAMVSLAKTGHVSQGASTITMQVARNFFLTPEKKLIRKLREMLLAYQIETQFSKDEILALYLNQIYLGQRAYGLGAAAQIYYNKKPSELNLAQFAMLAGLPKAPSANNPVSNPKRALQRRNYILKRMWQLEYISEAEYQAARAEPISAKLSRTVTELDAPYIAEMVRSYMNQHPDYKDKLYTGGYKVYTTIDSRLQVKAQDALRHALMEYDERHGYRGAIAKITDEQLQAAVREVEESSDADNPLSDAEREIAVWERIIKQYPQYGDLLPALVLQVEDKRAEVFVKDHGSAFIEWVGLKWANPYLNDNQIGRAPKTAHDVLAKGDIVYLQGTPIESKPAAKEKEADKADKNAADKKPEADAPQALKVADAAPAAVTATTPEASKPEMSWRLSQVPTVGGALVSLNPDDGAIIALSGGFDFRYSKFNRVTQAKRQPGSNFKPFVYSAALEHGFTAGSIINDAPVVRTGSKGQAWRPNNYSGRFYGPTRLREALTKSRNLVSIRLMQHVGIENTLDYVSRFGFDPDELPANLTLSLGTPELTPLQVVSGFAVFANGGYRVTPYFIQTIKDYEDKTLFAAQPRYVCRECELALERPLKTLTETVEELQQIDENEQRLLEEQIQQDLADINAAQNLGPDVIGEAAPKPELGQNLALPYAPRAITERNAWLMTSILKDVIRRGTATRALVLKRTDIAGKTGTTNDQKDAWFSGYNAQFVTTAWVGFDQPRSLGRKETGGRAALPMWIEFMRSALEGTEPQEQPRPPGLVSARIDPQTGLLARANQAGMNELFYTQNVPKRYSPQDETRVIFGDGGEDGQATEQHLF